MLRVEKVEKVESTRFNPGVGVEKVESPLGLNLQPAPQPQPQPGRFNPQPSRHTPGGNDDH